MLAALKRITFAASLLACVNTHAAFTTIDFSSAFNAGFVTSGFINPDSLPTGAQTYVGVPFQIGPSRAVTGAPLNNIW